jgi:hypothetical protein
LTGKINFFSNKQGVTAEVKMKKQILPNRTFLTNFAMQFFFLIFLFVSNILPQVIIKERVEINPIKQNFDNSTMTEGDGWWIDTCYISSYDSSEVDLTFTPSAIEPGETTIMTVDYDEDLHHFLERNITLEPNLGTLVRMPVGGYKYYAPSSTPGDTALVVRIHYEQFWWYCASGALEEVNIKTNNTLEDYICGCPIGQFWTQVNRRYGTDSIMIAWDSLDVKVEPDTIYAGGVVQVVVKKRLPDGTLTDFPPEQTYEVAKLEGCLSGNIVVGQDSGAYFYDVSQPIYFAVADSLVGDSVGTVLLQVGLVDNSLKPSLENKPNNIESNECFTGNFQSESKDNTSLIINNVVRIGWTAGTYPINSVPEMPDNLSIWVIPNFFSGPYFLDWDLEVKWISTEQDPDKTFSYTFNNQTMGTSANGIELLLPETDETIVGGDELTLTVRYTDNNFTDKEVTKKLTGMKILGENPEKQAIKDYIANHEFPIIDLPLSETVTVDDQILQMQILIMKESTWFQFKDERDEYHNYPADEWGYNNMNPNPHDWGLCQLSKPNPTIEEIWNWKKNINSGIHFLWGQGNDEKYHQVKAQFDYLKEKFTKDGKVPRDPNREEFLTMLSQRYKRGYCYDSYEEGDGKGKKPRYYRSESVKYDDYEYGEDFWKKFEDVDNGPPYPDATEWE